MTAVHRFKGLGWFASCTGIVLAFYLVSLQVASERNRLDALNDRIRVAQRDIRALETEFDTRANLQQLERWNGDILALSAPVAGQFVANGRQLASVRFDAPPMIGGEGEIRTAALVVPAMPALVPAAEAQPAVVQVASVATPVSAAPALIRAAKAKIMAKVARAPVAAKALASAPATARAATRPGPARIERVAMLDGNLLADLSSRARNEAGPR